MTHLTCVLIAGLSHLIHYFALSSKGPMIPGPQLPSLIVVVAAMDLIWDNCFIPRRFDILPAVVKRIYELAVAFLLLEIAIDVVWRTMEQMCFLLIKIVLLGTDLVAESSYEKYEAFWVGSVTLPLSLLILAYVGQATHHFHMLHNYFFRVQTKVTLQADGALWFLGNSTTATKKKLRHCIPALERHKELVNKQRRGKTFVSQFNLGKYPNGQ
ncbi:uncharacterized protein LOC108049182 [Drosophila rhopaloa]|uniref:Uncharacterized protein LOC108049182 n=1 Tax=Drosophila rhopaloa TaxID=1041015 RepID=A0A6P4F5R3_DRORH|nr:uncharacterized protein LOC108049182 [Drosophila rhopaloa]